MSMRTRVRIIVVNSGLVPVNVDIYSKYLRTFVCECVNCVCRVCVRALMFARVLGLWLGFAECEGKVIMVYSDIVCL